MPNNNKEHRILFDLYRTRLKATNITKPIIAIGGIDKTNVADVIKAGANGVAVVRAVCGAQDIKKEAQEIKKIILSIM